MKYIVRILKATKLIFICFMNGISGARNYTIRENITELRLWTSFFSQTIRDLASILFHECAPVPYECSQVASKHAVIFIPGYIMTPRGASPLLAYLAGAGFAIKTCQKRARFKHVREIARWAYEQVNVSKINGRTPILVGYSMGGDIAQRVACKTGALAVSLSTPRMSQYTFFAALDLILRGHIVSRKRCQGDPPNSLAEAFSFHIPRPDIEGHSIIQGIFSHFSVNNPTVIRAVTKRLNELTDMPHMS